MRNYHSIQRVKREKLDTFLSPFKEGRVMLG